MIDMLEELSVDRFLNFSHHAIRIHEEHGDAGSVRAGGGVRLEGKHAQPQHAQYSANIIELPASTGNGSRMGLRHTEAKQFCGPAARMEAAVATGSPRNWENIHSAQGWSGWPLRLDRYPTAT